MVTAFNNYANRMRAVATVLLTLTIPAIFMAVETGVAVAFTAQQQPVMYGSHRFTKQNERGFHKTTTTLRASSVSQADAQLMQPHGIRLALAGKVLPFLRNFRLTPEKKRAIYAALAGTVDVADVSLIVLLGWASVPVTEFVYNRCFLPSRRKHDSELIADDEDDFQSTYTYQTANHISQAAKLGAIVYIFDLFMILAQAVGAAGSNVATLSHRFARLVYTIWAALRLRTFKRHLIGKAVRNNNKTRYGASSFFAKGTETEEDALGKASVYDRILDVLIYACTTLFILDLLSVPMGRGLSSLFAFGGLGTVVFSLASRDLATQLVSGLALSTSEKFYEGDEIKLGDGTGGVVHKLDWMNTELRGGDDIIIKIPNAQLANQRVSNISRMKQCQVVTSLWFSYADRRKIPTIIAGIKEELRTSCAPHLITNGTRPFRVHWKNYKADHLEIVVDCHFNLPPTGNVYWDNRQKVLEAISRAVDREGVEFALPTYNVKNEKSGLFLDRYDGVVDNTIAAAGE